MKIFNVRVLMQSVLLMITVSACQADTSSRQSQSPKQSFSINDLYSYPSMIGTSPTEFSWSADGRHVVFLWNEEGHTYRDVWSYAVTTGEKKRLTFHADEEQSKNEFNGISDVVWLDEAAGRIAYVLKGKLYTKDASGDELQIETDKTRVKRLSLAPDGKSFAFVARTIGAENESDSLWVRATGEGAVARKVYADTQNALSYIQNYQWSADSGQIAFKIMDIQYLPTRELHYYADNDLKVRKVSRAFPGDETERYYVGLASVDTDAVRVFERPDAKHDIWNYGLSSDGKALFINSSDMLVKEHTVYMFDAATGKRDVFYYEYDAKHLRPDWKVAWAPNDEGLIILTDRGGYLHLYHQVDKGAEPKALTNGTWEIASFKVDAASGYIYFLANKAHIPERQLYRVAVSGGPVERVSDATPGTHQPVFSPDMQYAATHFSNDFMPPELYMINLQHLKTDRVTKSPRPEFYEKMWANISYVNFNNHQDGTPLIGRLSVPADYDSTKKYPLIVGSIYSDSVRNQWGGRTSHPTWGLDQYLVAQGYIVLNVNVRGSWGQGREHNQGLHYSYGGIDIEDLHSGVKHLIAEGYVDPGRVGIWGSSYGGLMTMMSLFKKPGVYAAGIAGAPATNVWHAYPGQMWVMGEPSGDDYPARYENQSAFYQAGGLEDPLMIIHGSDDDVVLYSDTIRVIERLIQDEKMFELVTLPGTGHGWDNEDNATRRFSFKKMVAFFNRHLKPEQTTGQ